MDRREFLYAFLGGVTGVLVMNHVHEKDEALKRPDPVLWQSIDGASARDSRFTTDELVRQLLREDLASGTVVGLVYHVVHDEYAVENWILCGTTWFQARPEYVPWEWANHPVVRGAGAAAAYYSDAVVLGNQHPDWARAAQSYRSQMFRRDL